MYHHYIRITDSEGNYLKIDESSDVLAIGDDAKCDEILFALIKGMMFDLYTGVTDKGYKVEFSKEAVALGLQESIVKDLNLSREHLKIFKRRAHDGR
jgi:hypothetical protein